MAAVWRPPVEHTANRVRLWAMGWKGAGMALLLALVLAPCMGGAASKGRLHRGFYRRTCPRAEHIVKRAVRAAVKKDPDLVADFVRMHFHDCFVRGCDASILLDSTPHHKAEKDSPINNPSLEGFDVIDAAKAKLEKACRGVVSCADIIAFAARDSITLSGRLHYEVPSGRRDGMVSRSSETLTNLPPPTFNLSQLTAVFASKGLTQEEMVSLSGVHSIGKAHCATFSKRLYSFSPTASRDPSLDLAYAVKLMRKCPRGSKDTNVTVPMDPPSPLAFDSSYYKNVLHGRGLFQSDQALLSSPATAAQVAAHAAHEALFKEKFAAAMVKMGQIGVLTGNKGEIRRNCRVVN